MKLSAKVYQSFAPIMTQLASGFLVMEHGDWRLEFETRTVTGGCIVIVALTRCEGTPKELEGTQHTEAQRIIRYEWEVGKFWSWWETPPILHLSDGTRLVDPDRIVQTILSEIRIIVGIQNPKLTAP